MLLLLLPNALTGRMIHDGDDDDENEEEVSAA
jgi:hypothetical protein